MILPGEIISFNGKTYQAVKCLEDDSFKAFPQCKNCEALNVCFDYDFIKLKGACDKDFREDNESIYFKEITK